MKKFTGLAFGASLVAMAMAAPVTAAEMVVIQSSGAPLAQGTMIDGSQPLTLASGASVTLISADGTPVTLTGPYNGTPADSAGGAGDGGVATAIAGLFSGPKTSTASLGAVRAAKAEGEEAKAPEPWVVSVEGSGNRCIEAGPTTLWRADGSKAGKVTLSDGIQKASAPWPAGQSKMRVPAGYFKNGKTYTAKMDASDKVELQMHVVPGNLSTIEKVAFMANAGCSDQAIALLGKVQ